MFVANLNVDAVLVQYSALYLSGHFMIQCKKTAEINDFTRHHGVITGNHDVRL